MWLRMLIMLLLSGLVFGGIFGYQAFGNHMMKQHFATMTMPPVTVSASEVTKDTWQISLQAVGNVRAARGIDIASEVAGKVEEVFFKSGDEVKKGDLLLKFVAATEEAQLDTLKSAADLAASIYERDKKQFAIQAVSQAVLEAAAAELKSRQAEVTQQEAWLAKKTLRAPFSGRLGITTVNAGQYLNPGETIVSLQALDPVHIDFFLPQQELARLKTGQNVVVESDSYPGRTFTGTVTAINVMVDQDSRNIQIEATVPNSDKELYPGMYASVKLDVGEAVSHVIIPQSAVAFNPYGETVYVVEEAGEGDHKDPQLKVRQTFIVTGMTRGDWVAVLDGLKVGDQVVTAGHHKLRNGSVVVINNQVQAVTEIAPQPVDL